jgi:Leucine rich repeat
MYLDTLKSFCMTPSYHTELLHTHVLTLLALLRVRHMHTGLLPLCKLESLLLHGNLLAEIAPGALSTLSKLRTLRLDRNKLQVASVFTCVCFSHKRVRSGLISIYSLLLRDACMYAQRL